MSRPQGEPTRRASQPVEKAQGGKDGKERDLSGGEDASAQRPSSVPKRAVGDDFERIFGGGLASDSPAARVVPDATRIKADDPESQQLMGQGQEAKPAPARITRAAPDAPTALGQADIMKVVVENKSAIKRCVDLTKASEPDESGTLFMQWTILPEGTTSGVRAISAQSKVLSSCMTKLIEGWKFPVYSGPQMSPVDFPFKY